MIETTINRFIAPLIKQKIFPNEEEAIQELVKLYILQQINLLTSELTVFEKKYQMNYYNFSEFVQKESELFTNSDLEDRKKFYQKIMEYEDDLFDWKAKKEILESWLGLDKELNLK